MKLISAFLVAGGVLLAQSSQAPNPTQQSSLGPIYRITVVGRTTKAINYNHRSGSTMIGLQGTGLMPTAKGDARVESKQGVIKIDALMEHMVPATTFGSEYLTYVMWAITPEGRATNVGEVLLNGSSSKLNTTSELQSFALIITAEPYFAVTQPSDVVVMENFIRKDTSGTIEQLDAKYELLQRGQYILNVNPADVKPIKLDKKVPLELYEARNAVQIARWTGAEHYSYESFHKAEIGLLNAEGYLIGKGGSKPLGTVAREAVQMAEDARIITVKKIAVEELANERQAGAVREASAETGQAVAQAETVRVSQAAEAARSEAEGRARQVAQDNEAQTAVAESEASRLKQASDAQIAAGQREADRLKGENAAQASVARIEAARLAQVSDAQAALAQAEADRQKQITDAQLTASQAETVRLARANELQRTNTQIEANRLKAINDAQASADRIEAARMAQVNGAQAANAQSEADRQKRISDAQLAASQAESARLAQINEIQRAGAQTEAARLKDINDAQVLTAKNEADRLRTENDAQRASAQAELDRTSAAKVRAEKDRAELRAALVIQLSAVLQTRDTARGLIVNMSDVLFGTAQFSLVPAAREKLAKVAGILAGHPGLKMQVEGYTDSVGSDDYNQTLSEHRAGSVSDYLIKAGVPMASMTSTGFGKHSPVATNDTSAGRRQNRRVELVVTGDIIGLNLGSGDLVVVAAK